MANKLCQRCFHSYVCEQFNEHRNSTVEYTRCHFYNDHFVDAADVEVVKHGRWELVEYQSTPFDTDQSLVCTCCGFAHQHDAWFNRCPNCGCRMDMEVDNG